MGEINKEIQGENPEGMPENIAVGMPGEIPNGISEGGIREKNSKGINQKIPGGISGKILDAILK